MAPRCAPLKRGNNANEDQALQVPKENGPVPNVNDEFCNARTILTNVVATQVWRQASTPASRVRDFTRMNPPKFHGSKVDEDPQNFLDEVSKVVNIMGVTSEEKAKLAAYRLKGVAQIWYEQWNDTRENDALIGWELEFKETFVITSFLSS